jgi:hypothetical protein
VGDVKISDGWLLQLELPWNVDAHLYGEKETPWAANLCACCKSPVSDVCNTF